MLTGGSLTAHILRSLCPLNFQVLAEAGPAGLSVTDIARQIQKQGLRDLRGSKTPEASIGGALSRDILFTRTAPATYALSAALTSTRRLQSGESTVPLTLAKAAVVGAAAPVAAAAGAVVVKSEGGEAEAVQVGWGGGGDCLLIVMLPYSMLPLLIPLQLLLRCRIKIASPPNPHRKHRMPDLCMVFRSLHSGLPRAIDTCLMLLLLPHHHDVALSLMRPHNPTSRI